ncbi:MAG: 30S ribosomal protein S16 [Rhodothermales bacterium]
MAVKLRLRRMGRKKHPIYAVVASDTRSPRDGKYIEDLGRYYAVDEPVRVELQEDRVLYWLEQGAQPTDTVRSLFSRQGLMLAAHMRRKGKSEEEIQTAVQAFLAERGSKQSVKRTVADQRREALEAERKEASKKEAEYAKARAEAEAKAEAEAEAARRQAAEERLKQKEQAAAEAKAAQDAANAEASATEAPAAEAPAAEAPVAEAPAAEAPAAEAVAEEPAADEAPAAEGEAEETKED